MIIFIFLFFISLFRKYENIDADESNNHTDDLDDIGPLGVGEPCNDHLPGTFLVIDGLDWPRFSILEGKTHEYKSDWNAQSWYNAVEKIAEVKGIVFDLEYTPYREEYHKDNEIGIEVCLHDLAARFGNVGKGERANTE